MAHGNVVSDIRDQKDTSAIVPDSSVVTSTRICFQKDDEDLNGSKTTATAGQWKWVVN